jgi:exodeoxyribonuclease V gamma subunit
LGSEFSNFPAEAEDPWNALAYRDRQPLDERFEALAEQLLGPALQALAADDEDEA